MLALLSPPTTELYWLKERVSPNIEKFYWSEVTDVNLDSLVEIW